MAKPPPRGPDQEGEISLTVFKFSMRGSDASLQKGLDNIKAAFAQAGFISTSDAPKQVRATGTRQLSQASNTPTDSAEVVEDDAELAEEDEVTEASTPTPRRAPSGPRKAPKIMTDLSFEDVAPTFPDFCAQKEPQTDYDKYKCIAYWFKHYKATPDITVRHFFTAYAFMNWKSPPNSSQPIADLRKKNVFSAGEKHGTTTINMVGEKQVRELKKATD